MTSPTAVRLPIPNGVQLTLRLTHGGQVAAIVLGGREVGSWSDVAGATAWRDAAWDAFKPLMLGVVTCTGATMRQVNGPNGQVIDVGPPAAAAGTDTGSAAVAAGCTLIRWSTATGGRTGKGRTFLPGLSQSNLNTDGRTYQSTYGSRVTTAVNSYLNNAALGTAGIKPAILSFTKGATRDITGGSVGSIVGVQRRRMRA